MAQKNDTPILIGTFLITAILLGGGFWWFTQRSNLNLNRLLSGKNGSTTRSGSQDSQATQSGAASFAAVQNVPSGRFNYGGSTSWAPIRLQLDSAIQAARPEFQLRYVNPVGSAAGTGTGIRMLIRDQVAFVQSSRPLTNQEIQQARQRGMQLKQIPVAIDGLAIAVNPKLNVAGITLNQLQGIYRGSIKNWQQVGGPNLTIQPLTRPVTAGGTIELFVEEVLQRKPFAPNVRIVSTTTEALRRISKTPGAIYFASAPEVVPQCVVRPLPLGINSREFVPPYQEPLVTANQCPARRNQLNTAAFRSGAYPITRNIYVVVKQNGRVEEQAGDAYANFLLTDQGQELLTQAGFVNLR